MKVRRKESSVPHRPELRILLMLVCVWFGACTSPAEESPGAGSEVDGFTHLPDSGAEHPDTESGLEDPFELDMITIDVGELTFDARVAGPEDGELVLLLHGFPQTSYAWRHALSALGSAGYRAVAPDQRGYSAGARSDEVAFYAMRNMVLDTLGIADALGADRFHIVGHDWGAFVAWVTAAFVKDRVLSLTAVSTAHPQLIAEQRALPDSCQARSTAHFVERRRPDAAALLLDEDALSLRSEYGGLSDEAVAEYLRVLGNETALNAALNWYRANIDPPEPAVPVGPVEVPTLYVWSDADPHNCRDVAESNADFVTGPYRFEVIEGVDHWIPEHAPERLNQLLLEHLM